MSTVSEEKVKKNISLSKKAQSAATIQTLLAVAMQEFSEKGYAGASTEAIVKEAKVTRGALYHHFKGKKDLFYAVFKAAQLEIGNRIEADADAADGPWGGLISGCKAFLKACSDPALQQIVVIDAPAVLDWNTYRAVDENLPGSGLSLLKECLQDLVDQKMIKPIAVDALAHLLSGAMDEAAVWIAQSENPSKSLAEAQHTLIVLIQSLKV